MPTAQYLSQLKPAASVLAPILTATTRVNLQELVACNEGAATDYIRAVIKKNTGPVINAYLFYDLPIKPGGTFTAEINNMIPAGSTFDVYSQNGDVSFNLFAFVTAVP
jgi:hypothetical protein